MIWYKRLLPLIFFPLFILEAAALDVSARSAVLFDSLSEKALYEKAADEKRPMASTTKIMTAVCALDVGAPSDIVTVKREYTLSEGSSMYLKPGETLSLNCLLHGLLLLSGNDAANAIAGHLSGSNDAFAALMNKKAQSLGLKKTSFENPSGLDGDNHFTTARDLARLASYAMELPSFREIVSKKHYSEGTRSMVNHNRLLWQYEGADGVKTGYTKKSGRCLVSSAERGGRRLIAVTLNASNDWNDHEAMLDYGFSLFSDTVLAGKGERLITVPVISGISDGVSVFCPEEISFSLTAEEKALVKREYIGRSFVYAPIREKTRYGTVRFTLYGKVIGEAPVYFLQSVPLKDENEDPGFFLKIANLFGF